MTPPSLGSLYSGVGGADLGFQRAGFRVGFQVEREGWRQDVLAARWPHAILFGDVKVVADLGADTPHADVLYASPPSRDPRWLAPIWPIVERAEPTFLVIEGAIGGDEESAIHDGCVRCGYHAVAINLACDFERTWGRVRRTRTFTVARRGTNDGLLGLFAMTQTVGGFTMRDDSGDRDPEALPEIVEAFVGLPVGWTCVCGAPTPGECSESSARLVAANECCAPAMTHWLGAYLLALLQPALLPAHRDIDEPLLVVGG